MRRHTSTGSSLMHKVPHELHGAPARAAVRPLISLVAELEGRVIGHILFSPGRCRIVVVGHPPFYPRFGFVPGSRHALRCEYDVPDDVFMVCELTRGALRDASGVVRYHAAFGGV